MKELKPCPFCGGKARLEAIDFDDGDSTWWVLCSVCGAETDEYSGGTEAAADAIKAWNNRWGYHGDTIECYECAIGGKEAAQRSVEENIRAQGYVKERTCHIETRVIDGIEEDFCTVCGNEVACYYQPRYCPNCGAKVVEK